MNSNSIWLLKSPMINNSKLNTLLRASGLNPQFLPTILKEFMNVDLMHEKLSQVNDFSGIFFTSLPAVEAVANILLEMSEDLIQKWKRLDHFVLGEEIYNSVKSKLGIEALGRSCTHASDVFTAFGDKMEVLAKPLLLPCRYKCQQNLRDKKLPLLGDWQMHYFLECFNYTYDVDSINKFSTALKVSGAPLAIVIFCPFGLSETMAALEDILGSHMTNVKLLAMSPLILNVLLRLNYRVESVLTKPDSEQLVLSLKEFVCP